MKQPIVIRKKLGRHKAHGRAFENGPIEIDERLSGKQKFECLAHEFMHTYHWSIPESEVRSFSRKLTVFMFKNGARMVEPGNRLLSLKPLKK